MRYLLLSFFILCFICCSNAPKVPKGIMPVDKMHRVMWDMLRADELANHRRRVSDTLHKLVFNRTELYQQVFQVHRITADDFKKSLQFYQTRPELLQTILDSLQNRASSTTAAPPAQVQ